MTVQDISHGQNFAVGFVASCLEKINNKTNVDYCGIGHDVPPRSILVLSG